MKKLNDEELAAQHIAELENSDHIREFFYRLGYDVDRAADLPHATVNMDTDDLQQRIRRIRRVATDPDEEIEVLLFEVRSVTVALTQTIAQRFRQRGGNYLLVLTSDYETLDFVLLERIQTEGRSAGSLPRFVIRPRILTVNRRNPGTVALRVLKRFTVTEADGLYQWDKLRSAYNLAEWSEPEFNNRALFSDYYLKHRLTDRALNPVWGKDVHREGDEAKRLISGARTKLSGKPERVTRADLIEPLLRLLGFETEAKRTDGAVTDQADYALYVAGKADKPLALALTYRWGRNLDSVDTQADDQKTDLQRKQDKLDENPGALVVSLLERGDAPWVILTNGKCWRLYSATASNKVTNYYEIDLEEALFAPGHDREVAFKYWWLLFQREAFTGLLDKILAESQDYAKQIGERLKDRVFKQIFGYFAGGFIHHLRDQGVDDPDIDLERVFHATMTFLYRLMFVLYAESLELVPVKEENGYGVRSLKAMKAEIATIAGKLIDDADTRLRDHYEADCTDLYQRLQTLFVSIDKGDADINLPVYNGGLFSPDSPQGQFLSQYAIPDVYLAIGLDRLARDVDDKTHELTFIDFKSLGVRQLGSIYEGLLEFKLRIAAEKLAVIKDGKREVYMPHTKATKEKKNIVDVVKARQVYIENTKQERKATGSYYTPDYIVKYIVQHTVGPVLDEKFKALAPRLRDAQKRYRQHRDTVRARKDSQSPELFWTLDDMQQLADDCLNIRVLDPAMGSGHFLVEVVDYTSNRLIDFLNAWSENPVWALLERTRADILSEMERQGVSIDDGKLTRVVLLKRSVLKRCVYGVDLNEMAVELAKVSLWLDAFTLGAPLSFLDHHLKWGNSLIGARITEVQDYLRGEGAQQMDMFAGSEFAGVMLATDLMRQVSYLSDNTVSQAQQSKDSFRDASAHLAPFKRILDVYTSRWFGNSSTSANGKSKKAKTDSIRLFLQDPHTKNWLKHPEKLPTPGLLGNEPEIAQTALQAAEDYCFFHWELEFPEVYFAPRTPGSQDIDLRQDGGFDAVVGNPPYDVMEKAIGQVRSTVLDAFVDYLNTSPAYQHALGGKLNIFRFFVVLWLHVLRPQGHFGLIIPLSIATDLGCSALRRWLITEHTLSQIDAFPDRYDPAARVFEEAKTSVAILSGAQGANSDNHVTIVTRSGATFTKSTRQVTTNKHEIEIIDPAGFTFPTTSQPIWNIMLRIHMSNSMLRCRDIAEVGAGEVHLTYYKPYFTDNPSDCEIIRGAEIQRFRFNETLSQGEKLFLDLRAARKDKLIPKKFDKPRIGMQRLTGTEDSYRILANLVNPDVQLAHTTQYIDSNSPYQIEYLLAVLSSRLIDQRFRVTSGTTNVGVYELEQLPIRRIDFTTPVERRTELATKGRKLYERCLREGHACVLEFTEHHLKLNETDVIHDLLAFLAQQMIDLNKQKQAEVKRFLSWLEKTLHITPKTDGSTGIDSLTGKTIIQGYLGDYQKGEPETSFEDFFFRLHQNRGRLGVTLSAVKDQIEVEYQKSLAVLLPIKAQLATTDALIDKVVYQLYGLTDDEIKLIEYPQFEQAVTSAREEVLKDKEIAADPQKTVEAIAEKVEQAATQYFARVTEAEIEARLQAEIAGWSALPEKVQKFLKSGELVLENQSLPEYSGVVISYSKAAETTLNERLFLPFRAAGYGVQDCKNEFFQKFMAGGKPITLGSMEFILGSSQELTFRAFVRKRFPHADQTIFAKDKLLKLLTKAQIDARNGAAHDGVLTQEDARAARQWAVEILSYL